MEYVLISVIVPLLWVVTLSLSGAYNVRSIGTGSDEFRKVLNAGFSLTAALAILSYAINTSCPVSTCCSRCRRWSGLDMCVRFALRKRLHRQAGGGQCMSTVLAVGHERPSVELVMELRREPLSRAHRGRRLPGREIRQRVVAGVPVFGGLR